MKVMINNAKEGISDHTNIPYPHEECHKAKHPAFTVVLLIFAGINASTKSCKNNIQSSTASNEDI